MTPEAASKPDVQLTPKELGAKSSKTISIIQQDLMNDHDFKNAAAGSFFDFGNGGEIFFDRGNLSTNISFKKGHFQYGIVFSRSINPNNKSITLDLTLVKYDTEDVSKIGEDESYEPHSLGLVNLSTTYLNNKGVIEFTDGSVEVEDSDGKLNNIQEAYEKVHKVLDELSPKRTGVV